MQQLQLDGAEGIISSKKELFINELQNGQAVEAMILGLRTVNELKDKNANTYYGLELIDRTGNIKAKIWSDSLDKVERKALKEGKIVKVSGNVSEFRGEKQMVVYDLFEAKKEEYQIAEIIQAAERDIEEMWTEFLTFVEKVKEPSIKQLLVNFLDKYAEQYKVNPAAERLHHAYLGGLLEHVLELLNYMETVQKFYPKANYDLVIAGIILHDSGKVRELSVDGFVNSRTDIGKLKGHLIISYDILNECLPKNMDEMLVRKLQHIVLSHHGVLEYGSPVVPKTMEAIIVHKLDELSASVRQYKRVMDEHDGSGMSFSNKDWALNTDVYLQ